jgi:hypothetical protein
MPISYTYNIIFIHIPKCAGTTIEKIIGTSTEQQYFCNWKTTKKGQLKTSQHFTYLELKKELKVNWKDYYAFSVVRNPYQRFVSEYKYRKAVFRVSKCKKDDPGSFLQFIKKLDLEKSARIQEFDGHLETQSSFLKNKKGKIEKSIEVFKFEELDKCWEALESKTGVSYKEDYWSRKSKYDVPYQNFYTPKTKSIIYNFYKEDFKNFGYSPNLPKKVNI